METVPRGPSEDGPDAGVMLGSEIQAVALGEFLREARARGGLTLQGISQETKIPVRHLVALERGNLDLIPGELYQRAEVRAYARAVGLSQSLALGRLDRVLAAGHRPATPQVVKTQGRLFSRAHALIALAVLTAVVASVQIWSGRRALENRSQSGGGNALVPPAATLPLPASVAVASPETSPTREGAPDLPKENAERNRIDEAVRSERVRNLAEGLEVGLVVTTEPEGASVTVDGIGRGTTPATILYLSLGTKIVRVTMEGYAAEERAVQVTGSPAPSSLHISLLPVR